ncbi:MAG TPA: DUF1501 domain-containing protein [Myxococcota bacterium]|nr:DUF1501 domain-containing protein [Myxococcota bacterium]
MAWRVTRRRFLGGAGSAALVAGAHVLGLVPRRARAALPADPVVVLVELAGGNDALNTVVPVNNVGIPQRSLYDFYRPDLGIAAVDLSATLIGVDPVVGTSLALHPAMTGLVSLYGMGKLAVLQGVGIPNAPFDHSRAAAIWAAGDPAGFAGTGWLGRYADGELDPIEVPVPALALGLRRSLAFDSAAMHALTAATLDPFGLPDDPLFPDLPARAAAWQAIFAADAGDDPLGAMLRAAGGQVLAEQATFPNVVFAGWGSQLEAAPSALHEDLHQVVSLLRYDQLNPGTASGIRQFHVVHPGYDTHAQQGLTDSGDRHATLLSELSDALSRFYADLVALGLDGRALVLAYSEFGRRARQNGVGEEAGTDHGSPGVVLALGGAVVGGVYGQMPGLDDLDATGNPKVLVDFRRVWATVIERWLGASPDDFLPGGPFTSIDFLLP